MLDFLDRAGPELNAVSTLERRPTTAPQISSAVGEERRVVLHREHPLAAVRVRDVFPHRLDVRLEKVVVQVVLQFGRRLQPAEVSEI